MMVQKCTGAEKMKTIAVFKTHVDIGFTDLPHKVLANYSSHMLQDVVSTCEQSQNGRPEHRFIWTMPAFPLFYALEHAENSLRKRAEALIKKGLLVWHALPFTLRTEFFSRFELEQSLFYSKELCRRYGRPMPISAKMTDVPGHTMALVDVLTENGVRFLHLGCNGASTPPDVPMLFWWESNTGNKILTYYDKNYGGGVVPPAGWKFPVHLAMCVTNDNTGVQAPGTVEKLADELLTADPTAEFTTGTMDDFAREILQCDLSGLPVIHGELGDTWIHGLGAFPESCQAIYGVRPLFQKICAFLSEKKDETFSELQRKYLENALLFGEHSGGVSSAVYIGRNRQYEKNAFLAELEKPQFQYATAGWNDERGWAFAARDAALKLKKLVETKYGVFFNSPAPVRKKENEFWEIFTQENTLCFLNKKSRKIITVQYFYEVIGQSRIEDFLNSYLRERFNWALCDFGRYAPDGTNTYPPIADRQFSPSLITQLADENGITLLFNSDAESVNHFGNARQIRFTATAEDKKIHLLVEILDKQPTMYADAGHICFDIGERIREISIRKSGVAVNPKTDIVRGANTALFAVDGQISVNGVCFAPVHTPLVSFGESKIYRFNAGPYVAPQNGKVLFNTFNNMWGTGAPQWVKGSFTYDYYICLESDRQEK